MPAMEPKFTICPRPRAAMPVVTAWLTRIRPMPIIPPRALLNPAERLRRVGVDSRLQLVEYQPFQG